MKYVIIAISFIITLCAYHFTVVERNYISRSSLAVIDTEGFLDTQAEAVYNGRITSEQFKANVEYFRAGLDAYREAGYIVFTARGVAAGIDNDITEEVLK